ncbi:MAG TPA: SdrD B-like domain-containing protein [Blastocatellia bacterium]|nr:SdrD B-like domain-containing protein [Blastocatellia bacterium]HMV83461.1 SdrD B-like domain-containing protein [Blastocatellia bacterium]HMX26754.1 SdrD B-like domain-containing protein [Blastocatellia bacterium]HMY71506.1 SdrD B-like domain-containing protein [Blastocatellia bacterium]HNG32874.1 SdrD B-like domain-containing protein [Blastocatellia bacterium]
MKIRTTLTKFAFALGAVLAGLFLFPRGATVNPTVAVSAAGEGATLCGVVSSYTPSTATTNGSIRIAGLTYALAKGAGIDGVSVGQNRCYSVCLNDAGQIAGGYSYAGYQVPLVCGLVTDFSKSSANGSPSVTLGGVKVRLTPGLYLAGQEQVAPGSASCLVPIVSGEQAGSGSYFIPNPSPKQVRIPALVHGNTFDAPAQDDVFALPDPMILTFSNDNVFVFPVNQQTFGKFAINESAKIEGFSYSTPNSTLQAVSCTESLWDSVMSLASSGTTDGDMVTINLLNADRSIAQRIAMFNIRNGGAEVSQLHSDVRLLDNAQATRGVGHFARFALAAGSSGTRTAPLTLMFSTSSPAFMGCFQLAVEIKRGGNVGTTTVAIENVVVKRMELPNDRQTSIALSLQGNTLGWYPTGRVCGVVCAACQTSGSWLSGYVYCDTNNDGVKDSGEAGIGNVQIRLLDSGGTVADTTLTDGSGLYKFNISKPGTYSVQEIQPSGGSVTGDGKDAAGNCGGNVSNDLISGIQVVTGVECANYNFGEQCGTTTVKCDTICWRPTQFFLTNIRYLPGGTVLISGVNANNPVGIQQATEAIRIALQGGSGGMRSLNKEFVTAQLSLAYSGGGGSPVVFNTFWSALSCSGISFSPVTLSNGVTLAPSFLLDTLFTQSTLAIKENRLNDMQALADIWRLLNGRCN